MNPILSIIIPCYNSESTVEETLQSVLAQTFDSWEALIINDGSPDSIEDIALKWAEKDKRFKYYKKENGGLGSARNYGITKAGGTFILPLDSDNKIRKNFAEMAIAIMEAKPHVGVVYGNAAYFGEKEGEWKVGAFDKFRLLAHNYIDACALIRKKVFDTLGPYDVDMPYQGHEDWEFWMRVIGSDYNFYYLNEIAFDYRVMGTSMIRSFDKEMLEKNIDYVYRKHYKLYGRSLKLLYKKYDPEAAQQDTGSGLQKSLKAAIKRILQGRSR